MLALQGISGCDKSCLLLIWRKRIWPAIWARPVKRVIQRDVLNKLSKEILAGTIATDSIILLDALAESWF
jgi:ATP-dependent Clp protease ATP-binding subunit ClpB